MRGPVAEALWIAAPFAIFAFVLQRLWFNAPIWDDYDTILGYLLAAGETRTTADWLRLVFAQHNEHRIAVTALVASVMARAREIDFRALMLVGNLAVLGTFLFMWRAFRASVPPAIIGAAALVMFQWSYYEASLMGSAAIPHLGVTFFAFGCLFFAVRDGRAAAILAAVFGLLAAGSQANGLFALPIAAVGCAVFGRRTRAIVFALLAIAAWLAYFIGYTSPPHHPSPLFALSHPVTGLHLFLVVIGGIVSGERISAVLGVAVLAGLAWVMGRGGWKERPVVALWVVFLLASAGAAAAGRAGLGVVWQSRYAIGSSCLLALLGLCAFARFSARSRAAVGMAVLGAAALSVGVSLEVWPQVMQRAERGNLLRESEPAPGAMAEHYGGAYYPDPARAQAILEQAGKRGYYSPPKYPVEPWMLRIEASAPGAARTNGFIDAVSVTGTHLKVSGWADIPARLPSRTMYIASLAPTREPAVSIVARPDVALAVHDREMLFSGFVLEADYGSERDAQTAAAGLCIVVAAPQLPPAQLVGSRRCAADGRAPVPD